LLLPHTALTASQKEVCYGFAGGSSSSRARAPREHLLPGATNRSSGLIGSSDLDGQPEIKGPGETHSSRRS
jgi:hypothetical protein